MRRLAKVPDRVLLEREILPYVAAQAGCRRVLLVGCDARTARYPDYFPRQACWTLERLASRARFGGRRHVRGDVRELGRHFPPRHFDFILLNGLLGFGLDSREEAEQAYAACYGALRRGGVLLLGWNRLKRLQEVFPDRAGRLGRFRAFRFPPLGAWRREVEYLTWHRAQGRPPLRARRWRHVFDFYRKP